MQEKYLSTKKRGTFFIMKNKHLFLVLATAVNLLFIPLVHAMTTTSTTVGEDVVWSISGISDSDIHFSERVISGGVEVVYYIAPLTMRNVASVNAKIPHATPLTSTYTAQRTFSISIPDAGIRKVAEKDWLMSSGLPAPVEVELSHQARFSPYQAVPAYPDVRHQPDKRILIQDVTFTYETGMSSLLIYILPQVLVGFDNPEDNGLPKHVRTEPDIQYKKPKGCNGCSEIGLPGYTVNMATLLPVIQDTLFKWAGRGPAVDLTLTWNAKLAAGKTNFGSGWRFSYDSWLIESSDGVTINLDDGGQSHFDIPTAANANVSSVVDNPGTGDTTVTMDYVAPISEPSYTTDWDGRFTPDRSGYHLQKTIDGDPAIRTFTLTPPDAKLSYIFQGASGSTDPLPLIAIEDWNGNRLQITRNASGAITQISDAVNRTATLTYNLNGQCTTMTVPGGNQLSFVYSGADLIRSVDLISNQTNYTYSATHYITEMNTEGRAWGFTWVTENNINHLSSITAPDGGITQYAIRVGDYAFRKTQMTDASGRVFEYLFPNGIYESNTHQQTPTVVSDITGRPIEIQEKGSLAKRKLEYNDEGALARVTEYDGGIHTYSYNNLGLITEYVDALNNHWITEYDVHGNEIRTQSPDGRVSQHTYNVFGQLITSTDPQGNFSTRTYDTFGNVKTITDGEGKITEFGYSATGINLTSITEPLGAFDSSAPPVPLLSTTSFTYDANRRLTRRTNPDGTYQETLYDCCAAIGFRNEKGDWRSITRSPSLKILTEKDYLGNMVTNSYDAAGRQIQSRDPEGRSTTTSYNELGQVTAVQNPMGDSVSWSYWSNTDRLSSHTLSLEPFAQPEIDMDWRGVPYRANDWQYVRNDMGRLSGIITPRDYWMKINFRRDVDGLLTGKDIHDGSSTPVVPIASFSRNLNGFLSSSTHRLGTDTYLRNGRNQVTRQTWHDNRVMDFSYNVAGKLSSLTYPDNSTATYTYDTQGRITNISWKGSSLQMQYDSVGNITREIRSNGINTDVSSDKNSQPLGVRHYTSEQTLFDLQCTRNSHGLIAGCTKSGETISWSPVLTAENTNTQYKYDHSFTIETRNGQSASTDLAGNQSLIPGNRAFSGTFDYQNLLTDWTTIVGTNNAVYDGHNRLVKWTRGSVVRNFHYDEQDRLLFETDGSNTLKSMWLYRGKQIVAMADTNGVYFYHNDLSANVAFLSDGAGHIVANYLYLPFGLQTESWSNVSNPFTFVGSFGVIDLNEGLYYMRSRTYDATTQAFLSNDPIGMGVTANAREYARNNPVNWIDPDGQCGFLTEYSAEGETRPRVGAAFDNKTYNEPTYQYEPPKSNGGSGPCLMDTVWNVATSLNGAYGNAAGAVQISNKLRKGEYGDAFYDGAGMIAGAISRGAGVLPMFMGANSCGEVSDKAEADEIEKFKNDPNSYWNQHKKITPTPYEFTLPPFSIDE